MTGRPPIVSASTREAPEVTVRPSEQLAVCVASTTPTETPDASPSCAPATLAAAEITPGAIRIVAFGSLTVSGPTGCAAAPRWLCDVQGPPAGLATSGSLVTCVETVVRAALARQAAEDCAAAGATAVSAAMTARPPQSGSRRARRRDCRLKALEDSAKCPVRPRAARPMHAARPQTEGGRPRTAAWLR